MTVPASLLLLSRFPLVLLPRQAPDRLLNSGLRAGSRANLMIRLLESGQAAI
jgi:hypothetical protein